jgi:uncharacterized protein YecE (DUF72 family)
MKARVGTSGYSYAEWKGNFFPEDLPSTQMLSFYAERFSTVEINNTFYRMPAPAMLSKWADQVPDNFVFALKAPRRITHQKQLKDVADEVKYLLETAAVLGAKLGPLLFQLPPFFKKDISRLAEFLSLLPPRCPVAFEFRNDSWFDDQVYDALRVRGAALCVAETDEAEAKLVSTASFGYLRLRRTDYPEAALHTWAQRLHQQGWEEAYVFFKHEDEGKGPQFAALFQEALLAADEKEAEPLSTPDPP